MASKAPKTHTAAFAQPARTDTLCETVTTAQPIEVAPKKHERMILEALPHGGFIVYAPWSGGPDYRNGPANALASFTDAAAAVKWMGENIAQPAVEQG